MGGRGQVLIIAALAIALTIVSTQVYVYKLYNTEVASDFDLMTDYIIGLELGAKHVVKASLISISQGGDISELSGNLDSWEVFVGGDYRFGRCGVNYVLRSQSPYSEGVWLDWGTEGVGITSACVNVTYNISGRSVEVDGNIEYNASTIVTNKGSWFQGTGASDKIVNGEINVYNEATLAMAGNITIQYFNLVSWEDAGLKPDFSLTNYGNGTYFYTFTITQSGSDVNIRVQVYDLKEVYVEAEETFYEV
jgi:hypothetical protein